MIDRVGGRKFLGAMVCVLIGAVIEYFKPAGISMAFATMIGAVITSLCAANAWVTTNTQPQQATSDPLPSMDDLKQVHVKLDEVQSTALKAGELAGIVGQQVEQISKLTKVALKVNQG